MKDTFGIKNVRERDGKKIVIVDPNTKFKGIKVKDLGSFGKRKFENLLIMSNHQKLDGVPKIRYE